MANGEFSSKQALRVMVALLVVSAVALVAGGGIQLANTNTCPVEIPFEALWVSSGHADPNAEAFVHWDEDVPPEVPTGCAKCHSTPGYLDFLGADGTEAGTVDNPAPIGTTGRPQGR